MVVFLGRLAGHPESGPWLGRRANVRKPQPAAPFRCREFAVKCAGGAHGMSTERTEAEETAILSGKMVDQQR
jgi:hypothetical protein